MLTCMMYVDLNPIRAGINNTLEDSDFTSIQDRLVEFSNKQSKQQQATVKNIKMKKQTSDKKVKSHVSY